ncbi:MAG: hypothetical protein BAJALOKI1v1_470013 [Promethearchaeota archaeon]|nr:MAG: hypothetical protein BAJALOKI1v1_470013 [Candidatus Lokiarchaeota archaeon]
MSKELEKREKKEKAEADGEADDEVDNDDDVQKNGNIESYIKESNKSQQIEEATQAPDEEKQEASTSEKAVVIEAQAYKTIILYASRYANKSIPKEDWKEIYGVLIGHADEDIVYVESAEALTYGHATDVQLDERHYAFIEEIQNKLYEEGRDEFIVGWWHSHPGLNLFFSYIDLINHLGFQGKNPDAIGLVFDHELLGKKRLESVEGTEHKITKYETGFEIYRMNDVMMDVNSAEFDNNYHSVDYVVKGLNKFFFANLLSELSALVSAGKPLQSAYGEDFTLESNYRGTLEKEENANSDGSTPKKNYPDFNTQILNEIPMNADVSFDGEDLFYGKKQQQFNYLTTKQEDAEQLIYEGNEAFSKKDVFQAVEKYRRAIAIYEEIGNSKRILEVLKSLSENCIASNHLILAEEFVSKLLKLATKEEEQFYIGEANYLEGYILLKKELTDNVREALKKIQNAAVIFEKVEDFVGSAICFHKIGTIYQSRLEILENSCLFYKEAIKNYNSAIIKSHPLRKAMWSKPEILVQKILDLKEIIEELLPKLTDYDVKRNIKSELESINYNF